MKKVLGILFLGVLNILNVHAMGLEQCDYLVSNNDDQVKIIIAGKIIRGHLELVMIQAGASNAITFKFPGDNEFTASRNHLPGMLEISVHKEIDGIYRILLYSHENDELSQFDLDFTEEE